MTLPSSHLDRDSLRPEMARGHAASGRILVVDDEPLLLEMARQLLTQTGYDVVTCSNGREALEALQRESFDAVLSDVRMPDMDGLGLLRAVREKDLDLPVVLMTGGPSMETAIEAVEQGALQYLIKPVSPERLLDAAGRAVKLGVLARLKREALQATGFDQLAGDRAGIEASFVHALEAVWMACQPIVHADGSLYAHEALLRTTVLDFPHPGALLSAAESLGRLPDLGAAVRGAVANLIDSGALTGCAFMNLHPMDLADDDILDPHAPLSALASRVVLEITERARLGTVADVIERVRLLRQLGYRIAIDDLGAGYAGLTSFAALSPDIVKLDMALVRDLDRDVVKQKLVGSITQVCQELNILVVAEGIETEGERDFALRAGCDLLQGFLIGRPSRLSPP